MLDARSDDLTHQLDVRLLRFYARPDTEEPSMLALDLVAAGRPSDALAMVEDALASDPEDADLLHACGLALARRGSMEWAQRFFVRAAEIAPRWHAPYAELVPVLLARGRDARAVDVARRAIALGATEGSLRALVRDADREAALDARLSRFHHDALAEDPALLAAELAERGRDAAAREVLDAALASDADDPDLLLLSARMFASCGERERAIAQAQQLVLTATDCAEGHVLLADLLEHEGRFGDALVAIACACAIAPEEESALAERRARLESAQAEREAQDAALDDLLVALPAIVEAAPTPAPRRGWLPSLRRGLPFLRSASVPTVESARDERRS